MAVFLPRLFSFLNRRLPIRRLSSTPNSSNDELDENSEEFSELFHEREFADMKTDDFLELCEKPILKKKYQDSKILKQHIDVVLDEYEHLKYNSMGRVPSVLSMDDMLRLLDDGDSAASRDRLFHFFFKREMTKRSYAFKKTKEKVETREKLTKKYDELTEKYGKIYRTGLTTVNGRLLYGLWHNSLVCRIPDIKLKQKGSDANLLHAALYGRKIIFDFQYDEFMNQQSIRSCMEQIQEAYGYNRFRAKEPFDLWFCNYDENSPSGSYLQSHCVTNLYTTSMITVKKDCFTNHFDKSRLVYLSPDSKEKLGNNIDADDIYIIGAFNDRGHQVPLSFRKAQQLGIRCKSLPLDTHIAWQAGSKSLCINHVFSSISEHNSNGGNWREAFQKCLPSRKMKSIELVREEEARRLAKFNPRFRKQKFSIKDNFQF